MEISPLVPEKKILKGFTKHGHCGHLGHVTSIMLINFSIFMYPIADIQNLVKNGPVVSEKSKFQFSNFQRNDLDLQFSHIFIISISLRTKAAIVSEYSTFFTISYRKAYVTNFTLP